jgi:hypothetical protein
MTLPREPRKLTVVRRTLVLFLALSGCSRTVGPVVVDATIDRTGKLHTTRCNLVQGGWGCDPSVDYEDCRDETGTSVARPAVLPTK